MNQILIKSLMSLVNDFHKIGLTVFAENVLERQRNGEVKS